MKEGVIYSFELGENPNFSVFGVEEHASHWARACKNRLYERPVVNFLENIDYDVFVDVGAGFGYHSLLNAEAGKKVIAFESHTIRRGFVEYNLNPYPNVEVYGSIGEVKQATPFAMTVKGRSLIETVSAKNEANVIEILDPYLEDKVLVKIDVEGHELSVMKSMEYFVGRPNFKWLIEFHTKYEPKENIDTFFKNHKETVVMAPREENPYNFKMFYEKS